MTRAQPTNSMLDRTSQGQVIDHEHSGALTTANSEATELAILSLPQPFFRLSRQRKKLPSKPPFCWLGLNFRSSNAHLQAWTYPSQKSCPSLAANASSSACSQDTGDGGCEYRNRNSPSPRGILGDRREEAHFDDGDASHHNNQLSSTTTTHTNIPPTGHT